MTYICVWSYPPEHRNEIQERFVATGGSPPEGVKMIGRWHGVGKGVCVSESERYEAIAKWAQDWSDLMSMDIYAALDDEASAKLFA